MRGGFSQSLPAACLLLAVGACSNIIGISSYDIDPALDEATEPRPDLDPDSGSSGRGNAGDASGGNVGAPGGGPGDPDPTAGTHGGGTPHGGGSDARGGEPGAGGEPPLVTGCESARDCDDEIDCTVDACAADGSCTHRADDTACDATRCETCRLGIGCVASGTTRVTLLSDGNFDQDQSDWSQDSDRQNIVPSATAQSGAKVAQFGPGPGSADATEQEYDDLYQSVAIPERTIDVTLTGYYKLTPGQKAPAENKVWAALYQKGETEYTALFFKLDGNLPAKSDWGGPFSYALSMADLEETAGHTYSFDIVGTIWDSTYQFDSVQLTATVCQ